MTRKKTEETAAALSASGYTALPYHAGMSTEDRERTQHRFQAEDGLIVVATIAFGMGIDKPDVRFVCHLDLPKSIEAYYQETGRAGRDGLPAEAWMTYGLQDAVTIRGWIDQSEAPDAQKRIERQKLNALLGYCEATSCRRHVLLRYFGDSEHDPEQACANCDVCTDPPETWDGTEAAQKALSCIYRTEQVYGSGYIADVLVGTDHERIARNGHDRLSTFGIGGELNKKQWIGVLRQLVAGGLLHVDPQHGSLKLTAEARPVLKGEHAVRLRKDAPVSKKTARSAPAVELVHDADRELFDRLRQKRSELAGAQNVPAYVVFPDRTLIEMAATRPDSLEAMAQVTGVGAKKLERYGEIFLEVITAD